MELRTAPENQDGSLISNEEYSIQRKDLLNEARHLESQVQGDRVTTDHCLESTRKVFEFATG
ncbi:MAG: hypothetical protein WAO55_02055, partial [Candidatus Manganitrophaceae bacterium]